MKKVLFQRLHSAVIARLGLGARNLKKSGEAIAPDSITPAAKFILIFTADTRFAKKARASGLSAPVHVLGV